MTAKNLLHVTEWMSEIISNSFKPWDEELLTFLNRGPYGSMIQTVDSSRCHLQSFELKFPTLFDQLDKWSIVFCYTTKCSLFLITHAATFLFIFTLVSNPKISTLWVILQFPLVNDIQCQINETIMHPHCFYPLVINENDFN